MAGINAETDEISDAMKEKVVLSILKNQLRQNVNCQAATSEFEGESDICDITEIPSESDDREAVPSAISPVEPIREDSEPNKTRADKRNQTTPPRDASAELGCQSQSTSTLDRTIDGEAKEKEESGNREATESEDKQTPAAQKDEVKPDPIKENEERLAAEESDLSSDQLKVNLDEKASCFR